MRRISKTIVEEDKIGIVINRRKTVRGIILDENKILLVYSKKFDDYMFPGGGLSKGERKINALKRELLEELGCRDVEIIKPFGYIKEKRYSAKTHVPFIQKSYYYLCMISDIGEQKLESYEVDFGVSPTWIDIDEAIRHDSIVVKDKEHQKKGIRTVLHREIKVLEKIKEMIKHEKI